ncbi:uncharacterized protein MJ0964 [Arthrobacter sp. Hiyo8]|nr:uncharacterized protein MJ0964 [Arthrobacter sp. Hiyo8]
MPNYRVSMDIGGTFTDIVAYDQHAGTYTATKSSTTPGNLSAGVIAGLESIVDDLSDIEFLVHGTTQGLNAFLERRGVPVLLLATAGVEDTYHIARGPRLELYNAQYRKPSPLLERKDVIGVGGRLDGQGLEIRPLDEVAVRQAGRRAVAEGYGAVAVAFLFSYKNPAHELRAREILLEELGEDFTVSLSHEAAKEWREYERTSSAVVEAYTGPVVRNYLLDLEKKLGDRGVEAPLHIMQSSGGVLTAESARKRPLQTLLSGPVGGAMGDVELAGVSGNRNLIGVDMGGTSFDVSLVVDGKPDVSTEAHLEGLPMLMSVVNIHTVGAGGGSVAWLEAGGLRVGPRSAGATPGPACYGRGGTEPTVTDANLVLGRVDPDWFAGGQVSLDREAAIAALKTVGDRLGLDPIAMAEGICDVANSQMAQAIRTITISRGIEPGTSRSWHSGVLVPCTQSSSPRNWASRKQSSPGSPERSRPGACCRPTSARTSRSRISTSTRISTWPTWPACCGRWSLRPELPGLRGRAGGQPPHQCISGCPLPIAGILPERSARLR